MQNTRHIAVLYGSLCQRSCKRKIAALLEELAPPGLRLEVVEISRLSPYTGEQDRNPPAEWRVFRRQIRASDGLLFLAPENSRTVSGCLRNALNIAAHDGGCNAWEGKPGAIVNVPANGLPFLRFPPSRGATRRLRQALSTLDVPVMQPPPARDADVDALFDAAGKPANPANRKFLTDFMQAFGDWIRLCRH